ncbi:hypothetical protein [Streptomyces sp. NPDC085596]|uniref:hypothetical protein n=1 Tax=Streptomyces sp. NPDC085596 TaxID=3365731 RepID=UPI0037CFEF2F
MAGQQVSADAALPHFRQRCSELQDENLLLRARTDELERENEQLKQQLTGPPSEQPQGPDLAALPPLPDDV